MDGRHHPVAHWASIIIGLLAVQPCFGMLCKGNLQQTVDWWIALKAPHGSDYIYIESPQVQQGSGWKYAHSLHADIGNLLADTLQQIYNPAAGYALYNDEWPNGTVSFHTAHAKGPFMRIVPVHGEQLGLHQGLDTPRAVAAGVLGFDALGGFWLLHSAPRFPSSPSQGRYTGICCGDSAGQLVEGQNFLCMSLSVGTVNQVARQLTIPSLSFYDWVLPVWCSQIYPALSPLLSTGITSSDQPMLLSFTTVFGEQLLAFHKPTTPLQPIALYEDVMEPGLGAGLEVQSWLNGWNPLPSSCPPQSMYESLNIRHVYVREAGRGWNTTVDHSKWAITIPDMGSRAEGILAVVCMGDMNRMQAQSFRGGGAVCFKQNPALWRMFRNIVAAIEGCSPPAPA